MRVAPRSALAPAWHRRWVDEAGDLGIQAAQGRDVTPVGFFYRHGVGIGSRTPSSSATCSSARSTCCRPSRSTAAGCSPPRCGGRRVAATAVWSLPGGWVALAVLVLFLPRSSPSRYGREPDLIDLVWGALLASFIWSGATQAVQAGRLQQRIPGLSASALTRRAIPVAADLPLAEAMRRAAEAGARNIVVVGGDGAPVALVNEAAALATPESRRPWVPVSDVARRIQPDLVVSAELAGHDLVEAIPRSRPASTSWSRPTARCSGCSPRPTSSARSPAPRLAPEPAPDLDATASTDGPTGAAHRRGPFAVGDRVQLTDPKGRMHTITLEAGKEFHTHKGSILARRADRRPRGHGRHHDRRRVLPGAAAAAGRLRAVDAARRGGRLPQGRRARSCTWPTSSPAPGWWRPASGSGALTMSLLRAVGDDGLVSSYERRADFAEIARDNVESFFGGPHPAWRLTVGDLAETPGRDRRRPGRARHAGARGSASTPCRAALVPGGVLICYVATATQLSRTAEALRAHGTFTEPHAWESLVRGWHLEGLAVRPEHRMVGHTGFLVHLPPAGATASRRPCAAGGRPRARTARPDAEADRADGRSG